MIEGQKKFLNLIPFQKKSLERPKRVKMAQNVAYLETKKMGCYFQTDLKKGQNGEELKIIRLACIFKT